MTPLQQFWHWLNLLLPALGTGAVAALLSKLLWRRELRSVGWLRLTTWAVLAGECAYVGGLMLTGRDGAMAAAIWLTGLAPRRRRVA
jgi:hypothetical protein